MGPKKSRGASQTSLESFSKATSQRMSKRTRGSEDNIHGESSSKATTSQRMSKRLRGSEDNIQGSPKKLQYDPSSSQMEKRDLSYCKVVDKQPAPNLKSLRFSMDEEDEDEFCGFKLEEVKIRSDLTKYQIIKLNEAKEIMHEILLDEQSYIFT